VDGLEERLTGCRHERGEIAARLEDVPLHEYLHDVTLPVLLDCLF
jgi:hypothetical protein